MSVVVGLLSVDLHISDSQSLKDKRMVIRGIRDRLKKLNVSVAEVEFQDLWQRVGLGVATVSNSRQHVTQTLEAALSEIERVEPGLVARTELEILT